MHPRDIALLRTSHAQLTDPLVFGRRFYAHLFARRPEARALFPADLDAQVRKLMDMLERLLAALEQPDRLAQEFAAMGRRHAGYGVQEADYDDVGEALFKALRDSLGDTYSAEVEQAWGAVYGDMAEIMIAAQNAVPATAATPHT